MIAPMSSDSLNLLAAGVLFIASAGSWLMTAGLRAQARLYLRFAATLFAALAVSVPFGTGDVAVLLLLPLAAAALMVAALARFAAPLPVFGVCVVLIAGLAGGLGAMLWGTVLLALVPVIVAGLAIIAAALNGVAVIPVLSGAALLGAALMALEQGAQSGLFLLCAAALVGLAKPISGKSALAVQQ
jgi:hypothetical protein